MAIRYQDINVEEAAARILELLEYANTEEIEDGKTWYKRANKFAEAAAVCFKTNLHKAAGIIAALSPACSWERNMIDATRILEHGSKAKVSTYKANKRKALAILYDKGSPADFLGDAKVAAFYENIVNPTSADRVTIDRHAIRIAINWFMTAEEAIYYANTPKKYERIEAAYKVAAEAAGLQPSQLQAITWLTYRRLFANRSNNGTHWQPGLL